MFKYQHNQFRQRLQTSLNSQGGSSARRRWLAAGCPRLVGEPRPRCQLPPALHGRGIPTGGCCEGTNVRIAQEDRCLGGEDCVIGEQKLRCSSKCRALAVCWERSREKLRVRACLQHRCRSCRRAQRGAGERWFPRGGVGAAYRPRGRAVLGRLSTE